MFYKTANHNDYLKWQIEKLILLYIQGDTKLQAASSRTCFTHKI